MKLSRRSLLQIVSAGSVLFHLRYLAAQESSSNISNAIAANKNEAEALLERVIEYAPDITNDSAEAFVRQETELRMELRQTLANVPPDELYSLVLPNRQELADSLQNADVPLLPDENEIQAQIAPREEPPNACHESLLSVSVDIFMEGLGLQEIAAVIKEVVDVSPEIRDKIDALARELKLGNWERAIDLVAIIMDKLSDVGMADLLFRVAGRREGHRVWRLLLKKLSARFVPFVGQVYTLITIGVALFNNRERLLHAVQCSEVSQSSQKAPADGMTSPFRFALEQI